jgi:hypothetical protein
MQGLAFINAGEVSMRVGFNRINADDYIMWLAEMVYRRFKVKTR